MRCDRLKYADASGVANARPRFTWALAGEELEVRPLGTELQVGTFRQQRLPQGTIMYGWNRNRSLGGSAEVTIHSYPPYVTLE